MKPSAEVSLCCAVACLALLAIAASAHHDEPQTGESISALGELAGFPIGVAVPADPWPNSLLQSPQRQAVVNRYFNSLTAENAMKMAYLQPGPGRFYFDSADALVAYAQQHGMIVHGHALVWHNQAPRWMNEMQGTPEDFETVLRSHVATVAAHFAGDVTSWDVVNEAFTDTAPSTFRDTIWYRNLGPGYIETAFEAAHAVAPNADLYYNDYNISGAIGSHKLVRVIELVDDFLDRGVPIDGIGFQMHIDTDEPALDDIRDSFAQIVLRGLKVRISELDISVNQSGRLDHLDETTADLQRRRYAEVVRAYVETVPPPLRGGITVWGITDADSWIPGFRGRPDWPLLFHGDYAPKPALPGFAEGLADTDE